MNEAPAGAPGESGQPLVLVVDDEPDLLELVALTLEPHELQDPHRCRPRRRRGGC